MRWLFLTACMIGAALLPSSLSLAAEVVTTFNGYTITTRLSNISEIVLDPTASHDNVFVYRYRYPKLGTAVEFTAIFEPAAWEVGPVYSFSASNSHYLGQTVSFKCTTLQNCPPSSNSITLADVIDEESALYGAAFRAEVSSPENISIAIYPGGNVYQLGLSSLAGPSPRVFTRGWSFEVLCGALEDGATVNCADQVQWCGSGVFNPSMGKFSWPVFSGPGTNTITLQVESKGFTVTKDFDVQAVSTAGYARVGDNALCPADAHGAFGDPLTVVGPIRTGSPTVFIDGMPAARVGDTGQHADCAGPNTFVILDGDPSVLIDGRPAARIGDQTMHCGGMGTIIEGSPGL